MIRDDIYYGNILGLLQSGKWSLSAKEARAFISVIDETKRRLLPPMPKPVEEPVKKSEDKPAEVTA